MNLIRLRKSYNRGSPLHKNIIHCSSLSMHKNTFILLAIVVLVIAAFAVFTPSASTTPVARASQIVNLVDGDTYTLNAGEVTEVLNGNKVTMLAYNGMIPGPEIHVQEGAQVTIHFVNNLKMPTLLHSHGVRLANANDGSPLVQKEIAPGASFDYKIKFTDPGIYWYHPHVREDEEQTKGLFGAYVVTSKSPDFWSPADAEDVLFLSDVLMEDGAVAPFGKDYVTHALMGRFGDTLLVNGTTTYALAVRPGEVRRFYVTNAATARTFNFGIAGAVLKLIGADGGRYEREQFVNDVVLGPSERAIVDVYFPQAGTYTIEHKTPQKTYALGMVNVSGEPIPSPREKEFMTMRTNTDEVAQFNLLRSYLNAPVDKRLLLTLTSDMTKIMALSGSSGHTHAAMPGMMMGTSSAMGMSMPMMATTTLRPIEWEDDMGAMNTFSTSDTVKWILRDEDTGKENMDIAWSFAKGSMVKIRLTNDKTSIHPMQHPIHFHGNRFVVLSTNGVPNTNMVWKDTTLVKNGDVVDILLDTSNSGTWMAHCHIAEHMESGMMMQYVVAP